MSDEKVRENRLRRAAERQGLELQKSRRRDPRGLGYGRWRIVDSATGRIVAGTLIRAQTGSGDVAVRSDYGFTLDEVETWLAEGRTDV